MESWQFWLLIGTIQTTGAMVGPSNGGTFLLTAGGMVSFVVAVCFKISGMAP